MRSAFARFYAKAAEKPAADRGEFIYPGPCWVRLNEDLFRPGNAFITERAEVDASLFPWFLILRAIKVDRDSGDVLLLWRILQHDSA